MDERELTPREIEALTAVQADVCMLALISTELTVESAVATQKFLAEIGPKRTAMIAIYLIGNAVHSPERLAMLGDRAKRLAALPDDMTVEEVRAAMQEDELDG